MRVLFLYKYARFGILCSGDCMKNNYALLLILKSFGCDFDLLEKLPCKIDNEIKRDNGFCERKKEGKYCH